MKSLVCVVIDSVYVFSTFALELGDKQGRERWKGRTVGVGLIILHMPSDNCNNAHVTELRCVIIGNFRFSNRYQSEEHEMASFKVQVMCHRLINCISFVKYITVSLVSVLGSSVGSVSSYSSGPKIDPRVQNIFGANVSLSTDSRRACCQLLAVKIQVKCLCRLAKEACGSEIDRPDI